MPSRLWGALAADARAQSGPTVARLFHRLLALVLLAPWLSLAVQVRVLIGARGLLPFDAFAAAARQTIGFSQMPTLFYFGAPDWLLVGGTIVGALLAGCALAGLRPRLCFAVAVPLYLSYATASRTFLGFQWDNLILECAALAVFLPADRPSRWSHVLFRLLLFKLYFESGIAKFQSPIHDWHDGSAMTWYYETAPLPTWLAWYAHHLPAWWHHFESRATLVLELVVPFGIFATRRIRLGTLVLLTLFQIVNAATANYGFFCYLSLALHVFLLDEGDVRRAGAWLRARLRLPARPAPATEQPPPDRAVDYAVAAAVLTVFLAISIAEALTHFAQWDAWDARIEPLQRAWAPWRLVNTYHLFGSITRERIEPEFQILVGEAWSPRDLRHKAGRASRAPDFVAPHQPRLDFQLWFHGLGYRHGAPEYVATVVTRLCHDPDAVQSLFADPLPPHPRAVRIAYFRYHFTTASEKRATGDWWRRELVDTTESIDCR